LELGLASRRPIKAPSIALTPGTPLARLLDGPVRPGVVRWIGLRPARRQPMVAVEAAVLDLECGLAGDRWQGRPGGNRQVTLLAEEHLLAIARFMGAEVLPEQLRRNLVVGGINLLALRGRRVRVGTAILEVTGDCHPCSRMEETLGPGGYNAVRGQGGVTARVETGGMIRLGDAVTRVD
jgi:MOSC domain-containing protein YiiM